MCRKYFSLFLIAITLTIANSWDIAITAGDQIEFFNNGTKTGEDRPRLTQLTALAYDAVHNMLLFVDNASIFSYHISNKNYQLLVRTRSENIQGIAFDPVKSLLFWTDSKAKSIYWMSLSSGGKDGDYGKVLLHMDSDIPRGIVVDSCRGYIYWTNVNSTKPTIERAKFDGSERKVIINTDIFMPVSIEVDQGTGRLYWADDRQGIHFSIESSDLTGQNRKTIYQGNQHTPNALTVSKDHIYWTDWAYKSVWKLAKNSTNSETDEPSELIHYQYNPFGIVANYDIDDLVDCKPLVDAYHNKTAISEGIKGVSRYEYLYCLHGNKMGDRLACKCHLGYSGDRCEVSACHQFCVNGECTLNDLGVPVCKCNPGYNGDRCEASVCLNYCTNNGTCKVDQSTYGPVCTCPKDFKGRRCEISESDIASILSRNNFNEPFNCTPAMPAMVINDTPKQTEPEDILVGTDDGIFVETNGCESTWDPVRDPVIVVLGTLCALLSLVCGLFLNKIMQLRKRPRIKKRIIVNKNVTPLTARPDQCEITIENCCNMNVCETPCFEPRAMRSNILNAKSGKDEKKNLIGNMEHPDDLY